jgi:NAD(P)H-dependent FMN reductase
MLRIAIVTGSTRPGRHNDSVAGWVHDLTRGRRDAAFELVDIADYGLPHLDEPLPPALGKYAREHTRKWAEKIASFDGFVFVTPEYNHGIPGALKNALDFLYREWNNKAAAFVSYGGSAGGARAVEQLRLVMAELQVATVRAQVLLSFHTDFERFAAFTPSAGREKEVHAMLDQLLVWSGAFKTIR